jgi:hypothetical protein
MKLAHTLISLVFVLLFVQTNVRAASPAARMPEKHHGFFAKYCLDCHDKETREGKLDLERIPFNLGTLQSAERWQKILNSLNSGEMPPKDETQPSASDKTQFLEDLSAQLVVARKLLSDSGGVVTMRRLNRREYENTIRALLDVEVDASDLPNDVNSDGFDTAGGSLFFSSDQFEQYLKIARRALDVAIVQGGKPKPIKLHVESEIAANKLVTRQLGRLTAQYNKAQQWRKSDKPPTAFGFIDENRVRFEEGLYTRSGPGLQSYLSRPETKKGATMFITDTGSYVDVVKFPAKTPVGDYVIRVRLGNLKDAPQHHRFLEYGRIVDGASTGELSVLGCRQIKGTLEQPQIIEFPVTITSTSGRSIGLRQRQPNNRDAARTRFRSARAKGELMPEPSIWIDWVEVEGPIVSQWPPKSHERIFFNGPTAKLDEQYARQIIDRFARRAFRTKKPSVNYVDKLLALFSERRADGEAFHEAIKEPLSIIMASPSFLYLLEPVGTKTVAAGQPQIKNQRKLNDAELAVRLSYLLWSSPPDWKLIQVARSGELSDPKILREQTDRMLNDPRSFEFVSGFAHQWLHLERLDFFQFNTRLYPEFDASVKDAARDELFYTIQHAIKKNLGIGQLLKSKRVVLNDLLADYYDIEGVEGHEFRAVPVPPGSPRGGLLATAAVLAMGSDGERSSPVERGAWVMRKLLNDPPPPAPANVPQLSRLAGKLLPARKLQTAHMEEPQCAQCHRKIDPIGYGLENFDAAGKWRDMELTEIRVRNKAKKSKLHPIDPSGTLPDGAKFGNFSELRDRIAEREDAFARGFTEALIEYGLGRRYGFSDQDLADSILTTAAGQDNQLRVFVHALVQSPQFKIKK